MALKRTHTRSLARFGKINKCSKLTENRETEVNNDPNRMEKQQIVFLLYFDKITSTYFFFSLVIRNGFFFFNLWFFYNFKSRCFHMLCEYFQKKQMAALQALITKVNNEKTRAHRHTPNTLSYTRSQMVLAVLILFYSYYCYYFVEKLMLAWLVGWLLQIWESRTVENSTKKKQKLLQQSAAEPYCCHNFGNVCATLVFYDRFRYLVFSFYSNSPNGYVLLIIYLL